MGNTGPKLLEVLHWLRGLKQKSPVPVQQSTDPHLQTPPFSEAPLPSEHTAAWLQALEEDAQTSPVADVQAPEAPQTQGVGLAVAPSPWAQAGPVKDPTVKLLEALHWVSGL